MHTTDDQFSKPSASFTGLRLALVFFAIMLAVAFFCIAIVNLVMLDKVAHDLASRSYSRTTGTITSTSVEGGEMVLPRDPGPVPTYAPRVSYTYQVAGKTYQGNRIAYSHAVQRNRVDAELLAARYRVGSKVDVFFDPKHPANAVLEHGIDGWDIALVIFNGLWIIAACGCALGFRWLRSRVRAAGQ